VAINMAMEIDLSGQVCADSAGAASSTRHRRPARLQLGRGPFLGRKHHRHRRPGRKQPDLAHRLAPRPRGRVSITRGDVHYVVSEYGVAYLHGKSVQERALALISIAHPDFREQLFPRGHRIQADSGPSTPMCRPVSWSTSGSASGWWCWPTAWRRCLRPILPTDEQGIKNLVYACRRRPL